MPEKYETLELNTEKVRTLADGRTFTMHAHGWIEVTLRASTGEVLWSTPVENQGEAETIYQVEPSVHMHWPDFNAVAVEPIPEVPDATGLVHEVPREPSL